MQERLRTPEERCRHCGGQLWHRTTFDDTGRASLTCLGCGRARNWTHGLTVVFVAYDPDERPAASRVTVT